MFQGEEAPSWKAMKSTPGKKENFMAKVDNIFQPSFDLATRKAFLKTLVVPSVKKRGRSVSVLE